MPKNIFIFVVCGAKEHIDTLHFSLPYLTKHSKNEIWVLTDSKRNEIPISHDEIIDIETPTHFDHHQASIYLKTGVHKFVPNGNNYCYLDTDIIAFNDKVDLIFDEFIPPIRFAPDHCTMPYFSPYALNCGCKEVFEEAQAIFEKHSLELDPLRASANEFIQQRRNELVATYHKLFSNKPKLIATGLNYLWAKKRFDLSPSIHYNKKTKEWKDESGLVFMHGFSRRKLANKLGYKWSWLQNNPQLKKRKNKSIYLAECDHLRQTIHQKFNTSISNKNFQHWNGGVFLFNDSSHQFLDFWHNATMKIFEDPYWKTRDQGTLIATIWKFGLQKHPTLDKKWNLIADYYKPELKWLDQETVQLSKKEKLKPNFVHVYHHFGDESWEFWRKLINFQN